MRGHEEGRRKGLEGRWRGTIVLLILRENEIRTPSHPSTGAMRSAEILDDWHSLPSPHEFFCLPRRRIAVKKRIKLPSFRVETFAAFYSSPSFLLSFTLPAYFFFLSSIRPIYSIHRIIDRHWAALSICPLLLSLYPLLLLLFSARSCFSRFANVCKAPFTAQVIHLSYPCELLTSDSLPPPLKGAYREIFRGKFSYLSVLPYLSLYFMGFAVSFWKRAYFRY